MSSKKKAENYSQVNFYKNGKFSLVDLSIQGKEFKTQISKSKKGGNLYLIPAMVDLKTYLGEPGNDLAETLTSLERVALTGGYERVLVHSNAERLLKNKEDIQFVNQSNKVTIQAVGSATKGNHEMSELFEMYSAGSKVFALPGRAAVNSGLTQRIQQYINNFKGNLMVNPYDDQIRNTAQVAETPITTSLGLSGAPDMSEYSIVERDIAIAKYNCAPIHFSGITTKESVDAIAQAKKDGIQVSCDVSIFSLCFTDEDLVDYNSNLKLFPFLRSKGHQTALIDGLKKGTIDAIASYHQPQIIEDKKCEFSFAKYGVISLQTFLPLAIKHVIPRIGWERFVESTSANPAIIARAEHSNQYILIDTESTWELNKKTNQSLSNNSPIWGKEMKGEVIGRFKL
mgnify:CR=1 FL=1|jgi:dihydroorotase